MTLEVVSTFRLYWKTIGYRFCDNIFKFTNKEDWSQMWKGIQDKQLKKSTIKTKLYK